MGTHKATGALMDARAAAEAEGFFEATPEQKAALDRLRVLEARLVRDTDEATAIKDALTADLDAVGGKALTVNGKNMVLIVGKTKAEFYESSMALEYPEIAAAYYEAKAEWDAHVPEFTLRVQATPAKTFPGVK